MPRTPDDLAEYAATVLELERRLGERFFQYFRSCEPTCLPGSRKRSDHVRLCRALYVPHARFMAGGREHRERLFLKANRVGGTETGAYELTCHLTGMYPPWWEGKRFDKAVRAWVAGDTMLTTRDVIQTAMMGPIDGVDQNEWTGMIPGHKVRHVARKGGGVPKCLEQVWVQHVKGGTSALEFKCHPAGTRVLMADGTWRGIEQIRLHDRVRSPDGSARSVIQTHTYAAAPIVRVQLRSTSLSSTPNHAMHTARGWVNAGDLRTGDVLTQVFHETAEPADREPWRICLTALMIGDGCARSRTPFFTCADPVKVDMVRAVLPPDLAVVPIRGTISYKISSTRHKENELKDSLEVDGLWGKNAHAKFIPAWVFRLPRASRALFLRWIWGCDGSATAKTATYASVSPMLIHDVQLLLLSFGIAARVVRHEVSNQSRKRFPAYYLALHGVNRQRFDEIGKLNRVVPANLTPRPKGPNGEVLAIYDAGTADVFCVGVEGVHELIVEGFRVGNSYDQGTRAFMGTEIEVGWCDEEPPREIYTELLMRTMTTEGIIMATLTPLQGLTPFIQDFLATAVTLDTEGHAKPAAPAFSANVA